MSLPTRQQQEEIAKQQDSLMKRLKEIHESIEALLGSQVNTYAVAFNPVYQAYAQARANAIDCRFSDAITTEMVDDVASKAALVTEKYK
jgi:hypothetical protein